jgi:muramoyltetrapeptide carboxypeptidase
MIYPSFLKQGDTIGISAPSAGVGRKLDSFDLSLETLKKKGFNIKETEHVRVNDPRGGTAKERGDELNQLFKDKDVDFVMCAAGGDFLNEMIPYISFNTLKKHPKWIMGASDPTSILYPYTTLCDVATIYGCNAGSYDLRPLPKFLKNNLEIIQGNLIEQTSFSKYQSDKPWEVEGYVPKTKVSYKATVDDLEVKGRCIGGCIDGLKDIIGTKFDGAKKFIQKYKDDGFIWYFDNFALSAENLYRTLIQMKYAGWFEYTKAIIVGRTLIESSETGMSYDEALQNITEDIPLIYQADIGHTSPSMTMINGAILHLSYHDHKATLKFELR